MKKVLHPHKPKYIEIDSRVLIMGSIIRLIGIHVKQIIENLTFT